VETLEIRGYYFEVYSFTPLALGPAIKMKGGQDLPKHMG
jgi:hypothetical protein